MIELKQSILKENEINFLSYIGEPMLYKDAEHLSKESCYLSFFFSGKALQDIRFLPRCPFTQWIQTERYGSGFRITVLHVTIDDLDVIYDPFLPHFESMMERFERTRAHLQPEFPWFFRDFHDDFLDQIH